VDVGYNVATKYWQATQHAEKYSHLLASGLDDLYEKSHPSGKIRVIAHSLGCKLLLHAIRELPYTHRPHEVHLCGGALTEEEVGVFLPNLARVHTFIYYSTLDITLRVGFPTLNNGATAIGYAGVSAEFPNVTVLKVDPVFRNEWLVHRHYPWVFHKFAGLKLEGMLPHEREIFVGNEKIKKENEPEQ